jgi:hypothetical protein
MPRRGGFLHFSEKPATCQDFLDKKMYVCNSQIWGLCNQICKKMQFLKKPMPEEFLYNKKWSVLNVQYFYQLKMLKNMAY